MTQDAEPDGPSSPPGPTVAIAIPCAQWLQALPDAESLCRRAARAALAGAAGGAESGSGTAEVGVTLGDDTLIAALNRRYRATPGATNVLAFPSLELTPGAPIPRDAPTVLLGDVVIAFETTREEAVAEGLSLDDHFCHLVVHGVLHLLGYSHDEDADGERMEALEVAALAQLGVADPYAPVPSVATGVAP